MKLRIKPITAAVSLALSALASAPAAAVNHYWVVGCAAGNRWDYTCWSTTSGGPATLGQPQNGDATYLYNSGASNVNVSYWNTAYPSAVLSGLYINAAGAGTMTLTQTKDPLAATLEWIGMTGTGTFSQSGGTNTITSGLVLGNSVGGNGTYNLSGSAILSAGSEYIGNAGTGSFSHLAGTNTVSGSLYLGYAATGTGTYTHSGGNLTANNQYIGYSGTGSFIQSGGTNTVNNDLHFGHATGSSGTYTLSGGTLSVTGNITSGSGTGELNFESGTLSVGSGNGGITVDTFKIGRQGYSDSTSYMLSGSGSLTTQNTYVFGGEGVSEGFLQLGGTHTTDYMEIRPSGYHTVVGYRLAGGELSTGDVWIDGSYSIAGFYQAGGTHTMGSFRGSNLFVPDYLLEGGTLNMANAGDFHGTFAWTGGTLNITNSDLTLGAGMLGSPLTLKFGMNLNVSGNINSPGATLNVDGGTLSVGGGNGSITVGTLTLADGIPFTGEYTLGGSGSILTNYTTVGSSGFGTFTQSGGTHTTNTLTLAKFMGTGTYNLNGGTLNAGSIVRGAGTGTFNWTAGTLNLTNSGITLGTGELLGTTLTLGNGKNLGVSGNILKGAGTTALNLDGGTFSVGGGNGGITVDTLTLGSAVGTSANHTLSGSGSVATGNTIIGSSGAGTFTQNNGTHSIGDALTLALNGGSSGTYNLNGGTLNVGRIVRGAGSSAFNWTAGTLNLTNSDFMLGTGELLGTTLTLGNGKNLSVSGNILKGGGTTSLNLDGGTFSLGGGITVDTLTLGSAAGTTANHTLSGSVSTNITIIGNSGAGTFAQNGGTHTVTDTLTLGQASGSAGIYNMNGGTLNVGSIVRGPGASAFNWNAGTINFTSSDVTVGAGGALGSTVVLDSSKNLSAPNLTVATEGGFIHTGGTNTLANTLTVSGNYSFSGGTLNAGSIVKGAETAAFNWSAGTLNLTNSDLALGTGSLFGSTLTLDMGKTLSVSGSILKGAGTTALNLDGGPLSVGGGNGAIAVDTLALGSAVGTSGNFTLGGSGSVSTMSMLVGNSGSGTFNQVGGTNTVTGTLSIGSASAGSGEYYLAGGVLNAASLAVNTKGTLRLESGVLNSNSVAQNGKLLVDGTFAINGNMTLGALSTTMIAGGTLTINNGTLTSKTNLLNESSIAGAGTLALGSAGTLAGQGSISVNVSNAGTMNAKSGNLLLNGASFTSTGLVKNSVGANLFIESLSVSNLGHIQVNSSGSVVFDAPISNAAGKTVTLQGGTLGTPTLTNAVGGNVTGFGTVTGNVANAGAIEFYGLTNVVGDLHNQASGTMLIRNDQTLIVGATVNDGRIETFRGTVIFNGGLVNNGVYITDPSTSYFTDFIVNAPGYVIAEAGDRYIVSGTFANHSLQNSLWDTDQAALILNGSGTQPLFLAGADLGVGSSGYMNNFAWGSFELTEGMDVALQDGNATPGGALYVGEMLGAAINGDSVTNIAGNGYSIYYNPVLAGNSYLGGRTYQLDGGGLLAPVPEPETWAMLLAGLGLVGWAARRRNGKLQ